VLVVFKIFRNSSNIVKVEVNKFSYLLLTACWDKLAQLLREFFMMKNWTHITSNHKATENNTSFCTLLNYLKKTPINFEQWYKIEKNGTKILQI